MNIIINMKHINMNKNVVTGNRNILLISIMICVIVVILVDMYNYVFVKALKMKVNDKLFFF